MFKKIPGNLDYLINLEGKIINSYGEIIEFKKDKLDAITIEIFGITKCISKKWLIHLAWYETGCINNLHEHLDKIRFCKIEFKTLSVVCGHLMVFTEPIYYKDGFRYIPSYPRYAINLDGEVLDTLTNTIVTRREFRTGYELIYIYNPDKLGNKFTNIHRLMGLAWLPNTDFINRPIINHLDGDRSNNRLQNLEWCSTIENIEHALATGLTPTMKMKSRDRVTGEVVIYRSVSDMSKKLDMSDVSAANYTNKLPGYLYKKRYEIKLFDDDTPWFYDDTSDISNDSTKAIFTITVLNKETGETKRFISTKSFRKTYKLWAKSDNINYLIDAFEKKYKDCEVSYKRNAVSGPYRVMDIETKQIIIFGTIWEAAEYMNKTRTEIQYDLSRNRKFIYSKKWIVSPGNNEIILEEFKDKPKAYNNIVIIKESDKSETVVKSIKQAARISGIAYRTIVTRLNSGVFIKGLSFRALE